MRGYPSHSVVLMVRLTIGYYLDTVEPGMIDTAEQASDPTRPAVSLDQPGAEATVANQQPSLSEAKLRDALASAGRQLVSEIRLRQTEVTKLRAELSKHRRALSTANAELSSTKAELSSTKAELSSTKAELCAARRDTISLQNTIGSILTSRSWRLTKLYRAIGAVIQYLLGKEPPLAVSLSIASQLGQNTSPSMPSAGHFQGPALPSDTMIAAAEDPPKSTEPDDDPWSEWPVWTGDESFLTRRFAFASSITQYDLRSERDVVVILKDRDFLDNIYRHLLRALQPQRIFEIGFFQGGMPLFLADMVSPEKIVGIDWYPPTEALEQIIVNAQLSDTVKLYGQVLQNDSEQISRILAAEFGDQPLDLIIDDASHEYENSKVCFEEFFGYLRPGGKYVIEDWGWLHWPGNQWQSDQSYFWGKPAMTNLLFELIMASASAHPGIIAKIEVLSWACVVITRGYGLGYRERVNLANTRLTSGREFHPL
jgi:SAM-dependent methyltransferase